MQPQKAESTSPHQKRLSDYLFTSESVSEGHPDKLCDQVSDAVLDAYLAADPESRVAVECATTTNYIGILGEVRGPSSITKDKIEDIARQTIKKIGYEQKDFHWKDIEVDVRVHNQSADIAMGVDSGDSKDEGAGDQGIMFGYACKETDVLMPAPIHYSHQILQKLAEARHNGTISGIEPDSKSQVTLDYKDKSPYTARSVVLSTQHSEDLTQNDVREIVIPIIRDVLPDGWLPKADEIYVNPTGRFVIGGPVGDAGLTGRKIIVDTYGGSAPHGGGAFSGKDPTKVDRSAAYAARYLAKNIVAAGYAEGCTIQLSYAIGVSKPISVYLNTHGTGTVDENVIVDAITKSIDLSPKGIIDHLNLRRPIYSPSAAYGHFGREPGPNGEFSWEALTLVDTLQKEIG